MSPDETLTGTDPVATPAPQIPPVPAPMAPSVPATAAPSAVPPVSQGLNPDVYASDGKKWSDKFYGAQGAYKQVQAQAATAKGGLDTQIVAQQQTIQQFQAQATALTAQRDSLQEQVDGIQTLREQIQQLTQQAQRADRYQTIMEFPELLGLQVEQTFTPEGATEPQTVTVNPALQLIEATKMPLDQLRVTLQQLVSALPTSGTGTPPPVTSPAIPAPAVPQPGNEDVTWARVNAAQDALNAERTPETEAEHREAWNEFYAYQESLSSST